MRWSAIVVAGLAIFGAATSCGNGGGDGDADLESDGGPDADIEADSCVPACSARECGDDGCGGACEPGCAAAEVCDSDGQCRGAAWSPLPSPPTAPMVEYFGLAFDAARDRVVVFGGNDEHGDQATSDTWELDGTVWTLRDLAVAPSPRCFFAMTYDSTRERVVLFGGGDAADTWVYDGSQWREISTAVSPNASLAAMAYDSGRDRVVLFGGHQGETMYAETWEFDGEQWIEMSPETSPPARALAGMTYDPLRQRVVLFGGKIEYPEEVHFGDVWEYDGTTWTERTFDLSPPPRSEAQLVFDEARGEVVFYGGWFTPDFMPVPFTDTWAYDGERWDMLPQSPHPPESRGYRMVYDSVRDRVLLVGGSFNFQPRAELWQLDGETWSDVAPPASPHARAFAVGAYDSAEARAVLIGGSDERGTLADFWVHDGLEWSHCDCDVWTPGVNKAAAAFDELMGMLLIYDTSSNYTYGFDEEGWHYSSLEDSGPPARHSAAMAYDSSRAISLLFGGTDDVVTFGDTWVFHHAEDFFDSSWEERTRSTPPGPRSGAAMAYDRERRVTVLFGGASSDAGPMLDDTWEYDGFTWQETTRPSSPPPRAYGAMTFFPATGRIVLFGGQDESGPLDDTWEYDGTEWISVSSDAPPPARSGAMFVSQTDQDRILLFGGQGADGVLGDTWAYSFVP